MSEMTGQSGHTLPDLKPPVCANRRHTGKKKLPSDVYWFTYGYVATVISLDPISGPIRGRLAGPHNNGVQRC
jgi:hypothetical protein